jgi:cation diffusion facilitator family transporter
MVQQDRYWQAKKVTLMGAFINALLGIIKLAGGVFYHSHALVADGVHSFADLFTDVLVLFASKYGSQDADDSHPYGHQRIETAATLFLAILLIIAGSGIAWHAIDELIQNTHTIPGWMSLPIICISIVTNESLFHYTRFVGKRIQSQLIIANAWHHRSDAASSAVVLLGLIGSLLGYVALDSIAAIVVGIMIIKMGWDYAWNSIMELVDSAVDPELLAQIGLIIRNVDGVEKMHQLRSRFMGGDILIDVHVLVSSKISVSEGHYIAQKVHNTLLEQVESIKDVTVHVDPEDDEICPTSLHLPNRSALEAKLHQVRVDFPEILFWKVHYLNAKMSLDIACAKGFTQWQELHKRVILALALQDEMDEVCLFEYHL